MNVSARNHVLLLFVLLTAFSFYHPAPHQQWKPLFDGRTLEGWHTLPGGSWKVEKGIIVGRSEKSDDRHGILITDKTYSDFDLKVSYLATKGNSGLYFRVKEVGGPYGVEGIQAEIDPLKDAGGLYETGGRGWIVQPTPEQVKKWYRPGKWNTMTITAKGKSVVVHLNGFKTAEISNDPGRPEGHIGVQLHGGEDMLVQFKDIAIKTDN